MVTQKKTQKYVYKTDNHLMQVKSLVEHSAILWNCTKLPLTLKTFDLSIFEWLLKRGFMVQCYKGDMGRFSKIDKTKILMPNGSLMKGSISNTFDLCVCVY